MQHILVVDDEIGIRELLSEILSDEGYQVRLAQNAADARAFRSQARPDLVLVLGDRGEMLAAAIAAIHLGIPVAHVHGGERSGSVDELVRHAISKLSHLHFTSTVAARERLVRMGERADRVWVTGAPGLDGIRDLKAALTWLAGQPHIDSAAHSLARSASAWADRRRSNSPVTGHRSRR